VRVQSALCARSKYADVPKEQCLFKTGQGCPIPDCQGEKRTSGLETLSLDPKKSLGTLGLGIFRMSGTRAGTEIFFYFTDSY